MTDKEVMQIALETAEQIACADYRHWEELASLSEFERWARSRANHIAEALRARLAQPELAECDGGQCGIGGYCKQCPKTQHEPEPVAWGVPNTRPTEKAQFMMLLHSPDGCQYPEQLVPLYTTPPQREWQGLTDEDIYSIIESNVPPKLTSLFEMAEWVAKIVEAKLKEKNNAV